MGARAAAALVTGQMSTGMQALGVSAPEGET
jgi:hypothetical protein